MKQQKESQKLRAERIAGTGNGSTLRTRVVRDRTKYTRKIKFKKSVADAADFAFYGSLVRISTASDKSFLHISTN